MLPRSRKVQSVPCFGSVEFVTCLWIACAICSTLLATAEGFHIFTRYGKQHEPRAGSLIWSRYGRSDGPHKLHVSLQKYAEMEPREYRFYLGSRYGKRSSPDYRTVSSVDRFSAALSFMDHVDGVDLDAENDASNGSDPQPLS